MRKDLSKIHYTGSTYYSKKSAGEKPAFVTAEQIEIKPIYSTDDTKNL